MNATANKSKTLLEDYPDVCQFFMLLIQRWLDETELNYGFDELMDNLKEIYESQNLLIHEWIDESKLDDGFDELMNKLKGIHESQKKIIKEYNYQMIMFFSLNVFFAFVYFRKSFKFYDDIHCETTFQNARFIEIDLALCEEINGD